MHINPKSKFLAVMVPWQSGLEAFVGLAVV